MINENKANIWNPTTHNHALTVAPEMRTQRKVEAIPKSRHIGDERRRHLPLTLQRETNLKVSG